MNGRKTKFNIGDEVVVKKALIVGAEYFNENSIIYEVFTARMSKYSGMVARIVDIEFGKYALNIDGVHLYTDDMLEAFVDDFAKSDYTVNLDVEEIVNHVMNDVYPKYAKEKELRDIEKQIDSALDNSDKKLFEKLSKKYNDLLNSMLTND